MLPDEAYQQVHSTSTMLPAEACQQVHSTSTMLPAEAYQQVHSTSTMLLAEAYQQSKMQPTLLFILLAAFAGSLSALTTTEEAAVRRICAEVITQPGENMIAGLVRLIFHDCVGGCNGCINLELVDNGGDFANRGLARYIDRLDARFEDARNAGIESRADYWALCAAEALRHGRAKVNNAAPLIVPMRYGRADCNSDSPSTSDTSHAHLFPNAKLGFNHVVGWCATTFGMTQTECVALLGAHTLGRAEGRFSGYQGPWVQNEDALDNQYYIDLRDQLWSQVNVAASGQTPRWQYATGGGGIGQLMMLNIDMCLLKDIQVEPDGEGPQTLDGVSNSPTAAVVERYANNDYLWIRDFEQVGTWGDTRVQQV
ncbi:putative ascorbate peroxidase [Watersipora subatra]|uniref:putative ascorbate peroxidase n=1 Tax=Watersipora subatra TaxID=2589382 RepID=UPI00355C7920